jgi:hypothetical protein
LGSDLSDLSAAHAAAMPALSRQAAGSNGRTPLLATALRLPRGKLIGNFTVMSDRRSSAQVKVKSRHGRASFNTPGSEKNSPRHGVKSSRVERGQFRAH